MNKAKVMLSALGVLAVIGSALAFKAHKAYNGPLRCATTVLTTTTAATIACPTTERFTTTIAVAGEYRYCTAAGLPATAPCLANTKVVPQI